MSSDVEPSRINKAFVNMSPVNPMVYILASIDKSILAFNNLREANHV